MSQIKIYIQNSKNESFEESKDKATQNEIVYKGITIRKHWNGFDFKDFVLGYKLDSLEKAKNYIDLVKKNIEESVNAPAFEWPENRN